jgi:hypothetical protein
MRHAEILNPFAGANSQRDVAHSISRSRREFLRTVTGATLGGAAFGLAERRALAGRRSAKAVVVTFGGGARDDETFAPDGQENIPTCSLNSCRALPSSPRL